MEEEIKTLFEICQLNQLRDANDKNNFLDNAEKLSNEKIITYRLKKECLKLTSLNGDKNGKN